MANEDEIHHAFFGNSKSGEELILKDFIHLWAA